MLWLAIAAGSSSSYQLQACEQEHGAIMCLKVHCAKVLLLAIAAGSSAPIPDAGMEKNHHATRYCAMVAQ
jgi:hypothetical protein